MRLATLTIGLACLAANAVAHPVTLNMAFISEADDGLTRQNVDALAHPEVSRELPPPSDSAVESSESSLSSPDTHRVAVRHHRHHHRRADATHAAVASESRPTPHRTWMVVKIIAFTHWWNGWSERNLHTTALDVHLDRPAPSDRKTA